MTLFAVNFVAFIFAEVLYCLSRFGEKKKPNTFLSHKLAKSILGFGSSNIYCFIILC